jgi:hypothetical protein
MYILGITNNNRSVAMFYLALMFSGLAIFGGVLQLIAVAAGRVDPWDFR